MVIPNAFLLLCGETANLRSHPMPISPICVGDVFFYTSVLDGSGVHGYKVSWLHQSVPGGKPGQNDPACYGHHNA